MNKIKKINGWIKLVSKEQPLEWIEAKLSTLQNRLMYELWFNNKPITIQY